MRHATLALLGAALLGSGAAGAGCEFGRPCGNNGTCLVDGAPSGDSDPRCDTGAATCRCECVVPPAGSTEKQYARPWCIWCVNNCDTNCTEEEKCAAKFKAEGCENGGRTPLPPCDLDKIPERCRWFFVHACKTDVSWVAATYPPSPSSPAPTAAPTPAPSAPPSMLPSAAPSFPPSAAPSSGPTAAPSSSPASPSGSPTGAPSRHPCDSGAHGCDAGPGGMCWELFTDNGPGTPLSSSWRCTCAAGWYCVANCSKQHDPHGCARITEDPTAGPSAAPSAAPTAATWAPSLPPTSVPSVDPSAAPRAPSAAPSGAPSGAPSRPPSASTSAPAPRPPPVQTKPGCPANAGGSLHVLQVPCESQPVKHAAAAAACAAQGGRLCSAFELLQQRPCSGGAAWSATLCVTPDGGGGHVVVAAGGRVACLGAENTAAGPACCSDAAAEPALGSWRTGLGACLDAAFQAVHTTVSPASTIAECTAACSGHPLCRAATWAPAVGNARCRLVTAELTDLWFASSHWILGGQAPVAASSGTAERCYVPSVVWPGDRPVGCFAEEPDSKAPSISYCGRVEDCRCDPWFPFVGFVEGRNTQVRCLSRLPGTRVADCAGPWHVKVYHSPSFDGVCQGLVYVGDPPPLATLAPLPPGAAAPTRSPAAGGTTGGGTTGGGAGGGGGSGACPSQAAGAAVCADAAQWAAVGGGHDSCREADWGCAAGVIAKHPAAAARCTALGARLCTAAEVAAGFASRPCAGNGTARAWTLTPCAESEGGANSGGFAAVAHSAGSPISVACLQAEGEAYGPCCGGAPAPAGWRYVAPGECADALWHKYSQSSGPAASLSACAQECADNARCKAITWDPAGRKCTPQALTAAQAALAAEPLAGLQAAGSTAAPPGCYAPGGGPRVAGGDVIGCLAGAAPGGRERQCTAAADCGCGQNEPFVALGPAGSTAGRCYSSMPSGSLTQCSAGGWSLRVYHNPAYPWACGGLAAYTQDAAQTPAPDDLAPVESHAAALGLVMIVLLVLGGLVCIAAFGMLSCYYLGKSTKKFTGGNYPGQQYSEMTAVYHPSPTGVTTVSLGPPPPPPPAHLAGQWR
eukprot:TRINITY_DN13230_c0_g2_i1.p1 TRINITY_DN13230_c0_g2~~TRINITY_DN13230_c0_g2_i1.p1  ORF type:complete len:1086 (+),score=224.50 TRINITY_DN13230_c0_g2_i1:142-3399(+)